MSGDEAERIGFTLVVVPQIRTKLDALSGYSTPIARSCPRYASALADSGVHGLPVRSSI